MCRVCVCVRRLFSSVLRVVTGDSVIGCYNVSLAPHTFIVAAFPNLPCSSRSFPSSQVCHCTAPPGHSDGEAWEDEAGVSLSGRRDDRSARWDWVAALRTSTRAKSDEETFLLPCSVRCGWRVLYVFVGVRCRVQLFSFLTYHYGFLLSLSLSLPPITHSLLPHRYLSTALTSRSAEGGTRKALREILI